MWVISRVHSDPFHTQALFFSQGPSSSHGKL